MKSIIYYFFLTNQLKRNKKTKQKQFSKNTFKLIVFFIFTLFTATAQVSSERKSFTYGEFKAGYSVSQLGKNLKERYDAGNYGTSGGGLFTLGAYHKFESINHFNFGGKFSALGASPSEATGGNQLFFNWWGAAISAKYYPLNKNANSGFNLYSDFYFITQFTQKYRILEAKIADHQFAVGNGLTVGSAYDFEYNNTNIVLSLEYGFASRTGDVQNVGPVTFGSSYFGAQVGFNF